MKKLLAFVVCFVVLLSISVFAADDKPIARYSFETRFSQNVKTSVENAKKRFGDVSDAEVIGYLEDISFIPGCSKTESNLQLMDRFRELGFGTIPALERASRNPDADIRRRAIWMACRLVYGWEIRKAGYTVVEEALSWLFCRSMLDTDDNVKMEAREGLSRIISYRFPKNPIPQGALEGIWLYGMFTPDSVEYRKVMKDIRKLKIPEPPEWFIKTIDSYEVEKAKKEMSLHKDAEKSGCIQDKSIKD